MERFSQETIEGSKMVLLAGKGLAKNPKENPKTIPQKSTCIRS
jgi:hypothetical protein